jgi:hypothetical protein
VRQVENSLRQKSPRDAGPIMGRSTTAMPDGYKSVHLQQGQSADERRIPRVQRPQFLFQDREQSLLQYLSENTVNIV